jgi:hypothetical protein
MVVPFFFFFIFSITIYVFSQITQEKKLQKSRWQTPVSPKQHTTKEATIHTHIISIERCTTYLTLPYYTERAVTIIREKIFSDFAS